MLHIIYTYTTSEKLKKNLTGNFLLDSVKSFYLFGKKTHLYSIIFTFEDIVCFSV